MLIPKKTPVNSTHSRYCGGKGNATLTCLPAVNVPFGVAVDSADYHIESDTEPVTIEFNFGTAEARAMLL